MSLDLWLRCQHCQKSGESFNYTYNVSRMWCEATGQDKMIKIDGMTGKESLPILKDALAELQRIPSKYKKFDPCNGWGSYESFCLFIERLIKEAEENPGSIWESWR